MAEKRYCIKCKQHFTVDAFYAHFRACRGKAKETAKDPEANFTVETVEENITQPEPKKTGRKAKETA